MVLRSSLNSFTLNRSIHIKTGFVSFHWQEENKEAQLEIIEERGRGVVLSAVNIEKDHSLGNSKNSSFDSKAEEVGKK